MITSKFYTIRKNQLPKFLISLAREFSIFIPVKEGKSWNFRRMKSVKDLDLKGYINTEFPPRSILLPEGEVLYRFEKGGVKEVYPKRRNLIFGVRPCDIHGLVVLDRVMLSDPVDTHYKKRREKTFIVGLECREAGENCFCESMGTREVNEGFDLMLTEQARTYHVEVGSKRGGEMMRRFKWASKSKKRPKRPKLKFKKKLDTENLVDIMRESFNSKIWEKTARERCLSCASCTSVCPTCYCFDIEHVGSIEKPGFFEIVRNHTYCMLKDFTRVARDMRFRESRTERLKQFFYHKLVYGKENQGKFHCVGCGRCITECMTGIDITEEVKKVRDEYEKKIRP